MRGLLLSCFIIAILPSLAVAQLPGTWERIAICDTCKDPGYLHVTDTAICVVSEGPSKSILTTQSWDKGNSFVRRGGGADYWFTQNPATLSFADGHLFLFRDGQCIATTDSGDNWQSREFLGTSQTTVAAWMKDRAEGIWLFGQGGALAGRATFDSGHFFIDRVFEEWRTTPLHPRAEGIILSPDTILLTLTKTSSPNSIAFGKSIDGGNKWQLIHLIDTMHERILRVGALRTGYSPNRIFIPEGIFDSSSYFYSTDFGDSWQEVRGETAARTYRVMETAPDRFWLLVGPKGPAARHLYSYKSIVDTLYFSSDQGKSWIKDLSFVGDRVCEIKWVGPDEGYVLSKKGSITYLSRFVPGVKSVDAGLAVRSRMTRMHIYPNPASDRISFTPKYAGAAVLKFLDVIGREVYRTEITLTRMQQVSVILPDHLPHGVLMCSLDYASGKHEAGSFVR